MLPIAMITFKSLTEVVSTFWIKEAKCRNADSWHVASTTHPCTDPVLSFLVLPYSVPFKWCTFIYSLSFTVRKWSMLIQSDLCAEKVRRALSSSPHRASPVKCVCFNPICLNNPKTVLGTYIAPIIKVHKYLPAFHVFILTTPLWGGEVLSFPFYRWGTETQTKWLVQGYTGRLWQSRVLNPRFPKPRPDP